MRGHIGIADLAEPLEEARDLSTGHHGTVLDIAAALLEAPCRSRHSRDGFDIEANVSVLLRSRRACSQVSLCTRSVPGPVTLISTVAKALILLVPQEGLEPPTPSLRMTCSTD